MREIKFNAWVPKLGIMLENVTLYPDGTMGICSGDFEEALPEKYILTDDAVYHEDNEKDIYELIMTILPGEDWIWFEEGEFEPLQFTGLTDKNGKEIFEGNIVKTSHFVLKIGVIYYIDNAFEIKDLKSSVCIKDPIFRECEIIGNIYENPELLNP